MKILVFKIDRCWHSFCSSMGMDTIAFTVKDCSLAALATGVRAESLKELSERLVTIAPSSLYYHFWGSRLHSHYAHPEYHNDFATWAHFYLRDQILAEKLGIIDPTEFEHLESLGIHLLEIVDNRLDEIRELGFVKSLQPFYFIHAKTLVFTTSLSLKEPKELVSLLPKMTLSSLFYHFIDARRRTEKGVDDFSLWLESFDSTYQDLIRQLRTIDPYFTSLAELRDIVLNILKVHLIHE